MAHVLRPTRIRSSVLALIVLTGILAVTSHTRVSAQTNNFVVYNDSLVSGWRDWSDATSDVYWKVTKPVYLGNYSASFIVQAGGARFYIHTKTAFNTSGYGYLHFAAEASQTGQQYTVAMTDTSGNYLLSPQPLSAFGGNPVAGAWTVYNIPLANLGASSRLISGIVIKDASGHAQPAVYIDDIEFTATAPTPTESGEW